EHGRQVVAAAVDESDRRGVVAADAALQLDVVLERPAGHETRIHHEDRPRRQRNRVARRRVAERGGKWRSARAGAAAVARAVQVDGEARWIAALRVALLDDRE